MLAKVTYLWYAVTNISQNTENRNMLTKLECQPLNVCVYTTMLRIQQLNTVTSE